MHISTPNSSCRPPRFMLPRRFLLGSSSSYLGLCSIYPFGVVYDLRNKELVSTPPGHVAILGHEISISKVIQLLRYSGLRQRRPGNRAKSLSLECSSH